MRYMIAIETDELNTILAALRYYQHEGMSDPMERPDWLQEIACPDGGRQTSLSADDIDELCERINTAPEAAPSDFNPRERCANCGRQRSDHWGPAHGARVVGCSGFVPTGRLVGA